MATSRGDGVRLITDQRRAKIVTLVHEYGTLSIEDLVNKLDVSQMTIWRDLVMLDNAGKVRRVRGGVTRIETEISKEPFYLNKRVINKEQKRAIAQFAVEHFVNDNDIIIIEAGTTAGAMIEFFSQHNLTIMTNGLGNLNDLSCCVPDITIISCGGMLRDIAHTFVGPQAEEFFKSVRAQTLFLSATGIAFPEGITDLNPLEIQVKRTMAESASKIVLLMDSSKFGQRSLAQVLPLEKIHAIVTDQGAPTDIVDQLRALGIQVFITP